jgi:hypothetical protein
MLAVSAIPVVSMPGALPPGPGLGDSPPVEAPVKLENDKTFFVKGTMFLPLIGTVQVDLQVTTCKQGTSGCTPP